MAMNCNQLIILILIFTTINTTTSLEEDENTLDQEISYPNAPIFYEEGDVCTTNSGKSGKCMEISKCQSIGELLVVKEPAVTCGFGVFEEIICCPNKQVSKDVIDPPKPTSTTTITPFINMFSTTPLQNINTSGNSKKVDESQYQEFLQLVGNALKPEPLENQTFTKSGTIGDNENPFLPKRNKTDEPKIINPWLHTVGSTTLSNIKRPETSSRAPPNNNNPIIYPSEYEEESTTKSPVSTRSKERPAVLACKEIDKYRTPGITIHILNGETVDLGEYPHVVALGYADLGGDEYDFRCGGSLIASRFVLTAAHCVNRRDMSPKIVRMGIANMDDKIEVNNAVDRSIQKVHIHPEYSNGRSYNDIAVIELEREVEYTNNVKPVCLFTDDDDPSEKPIVTVTGWGVTNVTTRTISKRLLKATLGVVTLEACRIEYTSNRQLPQGIISSQMCAVDPQGKKDACQGDSGGPLNLVVDESSNHYKLLGITSTGYGCGSLIPGIYTRVSSYIDFIESVVWPTNSSI